MATAGCVLVIAAAGGSWRRAAVAAGGRAATARSKKAKAESRGGRTPSEAQVLFEEDCALQTVETRIHDQRRRLNEFNVSGTQRCESNDANPTYQRPFGGSGNKSDRGLNLDQDERFERGKLSIPARAPM